MLVTIKKEVDIFTLDVEDLMSLSKETLVDAILEACDTARKGES